MRWAIGLLTLLLLLGCSSISQVAGDSTLGPDVTQDFRNNGYQAAWYHVYFTDPSGSQAEFLRGGPDAALAEAILAARVSVDIAMDSFNLWSLRGLFHQKHSQLQQHPCTTLTPNQLLANSLAIR